MSSAENNSDDWREIRARADSIANVVFLFAGGALSVSISVMLDGKANGLITAEVAKVATVAWCVLASSVVVFLLLKGHMILQAFLLQFKPSFVNRRLALLNGIGWALGIVGFLSFVVGLYQMVQAAVLAISA